MIQMTNNHTPNERRQVIVFLLNVLQAVINEQVSIKQLKKDVGDYIYQAVKDQVIRQGWLE